MNKTLGPKWIVHVVKIYKISDLPLKLSSLSSKEKKQTKKNRRKKTVFCFWGIMEANSLYNY